MLDLETFIFVCYNLRPSDLLSLVCVCKTFKSILDENINPLAEEIWRNSRIKFTTFRDMEPPSGMNQHTFTRLLTFEKGCQFCKTKEKALTIYWIPGVRSCRDCMFPRVSHILGSTFKIDNEVLGLILPVTPSIDLPESKHTHYWIDHVKNVIAFLMNADDNMRRALNNLRKDVGNKYKETKNYEKWMFNLRQFYLRGQDDHFSRLHAEINRETLFKMQEDYEYKKLKTEIQCNPFLVQDWQQYKSRILQIAQRIDRNLTSTTFPPTLVSSKNKIVDKITQKRIKIVKRLRKLTYGSKRTSQCQIISIFDVLYVYLPICPSFVNPPDLEEYSQEFFIRKLLPTLKREAEQLCASRTTPPPYFLEMDGALKVGGLRDQLVFECRLCNTLDPSNIKKIRAHIKDVHELDENLNNVLFATKFYNFNNKVIAQC
ncbi:460_t:CDS:2 [Dentiscutata erythropus]|uniref:460_t:CDS:1 n=1 Tax=Dentiscutata erythropus TaxID=1348616 RepID=A0A9N9NKZ7_9GLOM|nr:460_t:CDS:2 [Dentiscutata erythropus]